MKSNIYILNTETRFFMIPYRFLEYKKKKRYGIVKRAVLKHFY